jgi:hypothetical protein
MAREHDPRAEIERIRREHYPNEYDNKCAKCGEPYACDAAWLLGDALDALDARERRRQRSTLGSGRTTKGSGANGPHWISNPRVAG